MKVLRAIVVSLITVGFLIHSEISSAAAPEYLGQFCWQGSRATGSSLLKAALTHMGDGHYLVNGRGTDSNGNIEAIYGSAEIAGNKIYLTTTSAGGNASETWTFIGFWLLDVATLNGTGEIMGVGHVQTQPPSDNAKVEYDGPFTMTFVPCP